MRHTSHWPLLSVILSDLCHFIQCSERVQSIVRNRYGKLMQNFCSDYEQASQIMYSVIDIIRKETCDEYAVNQTIDILIGEINKQKREELLSGYHFPSVYEYTHCASSHRLVNVFIDIMNGLPHTAGISPTLNLVASFYKYNDIKACFEDDEHEYVIFLERISSILKEYEQHIIVEDELNILIDKEVSLFESKINKLMNNIRILNSLMCKTKS